MLKNYNYMRFINIIYITANLAPNGLFCYFRFPELYKIFILYNRVYIIYTWSTVSTYLLCLILKARLIPYLTTQVILLTNKKRASTQETSCMSALFIFILLYELVIDCLKCNDIIMLVNTYDDVKLAGALVYHSDVNTGISERCEYTRSCSLRFYHSATNYSNERKVILGKDVIGINRLADGCHDIATLLRKILA